MKTKGPPKQCKDCCYFWEHGRKDGVHNRWCCLFSKAAVKALGECKLTGGFSLKSDLTKLPNMSDFGICEGDTCWRYGCQGVIKVRKADNCSCHINPPCSACTSPREYCPECGWDAANE